MMRYINIDINILSGAYVFIGIFVSISTYVSVFLFAYTG